MDTQIIASSIEAAGMVVAALITVIGLLATSSVLLSRKSLRNRLAEAYRDLRVMQEVEQVHIDMEVGRVGISNQRKVRDIVAKEKGLRTSGNNSPAQVERKLERLSSVED